MAQPSWETMDTLQARVAKMETALAQATAEKYAIAAERDALNEESRPTTYD